MNERKNHGVCILRTGNRTDQYPAALTLGEAQITAVNISNHEGKHSTYRPVISLNNANSSTDLYGTNMALILLLRTGNRGKKARV
jgi:uncharacterized membrane protein